MPSTLGFGIGPVRRQRARWPAIGMVLCLSSIVLCIALDPPLPGVALGLLVVVAGLAAWSGWRSGGAGETGSLLVDPAGQARWLGEPRADQALSVPLMPRRWQLGAGEVWLLAEDDRGARLHLRVSRRDCDERQWRALRRWLVWAGRAGPKAIPT